MRWCVYPVESIGVRVDQLGFWSYELRVQLSCKSVSRVECRCVGLTESWLEVVPKQSRVLKRVTETAWWFYHWGTNIGISRDAWHTELLHSTHLTTHCSTYVLMIIITTVIIILCINPLQLFDYKK